MKKKLLLFLLLGIAASAFAQLQVPPGIFFGRKPVVTKFNDVCDIFGDKMALYDPEMNMLLLRDGFRYHLLEGFLTVSTGEPFRIRLEGNAYIEAAFVSKDPIIIESDGYNTLTIVSNASTTALVCPKLVLDDYFTSLSLFSDAPNKEMIALDCSGEVVVNGGGLRMEVAHSPKAAVIGALTLNGSVLRTPRAVTINPDGVVCDDKGRYARLIEIVPEP